MKSLSYLNTFSGQSVAYNDQGLGSQNLANRYQINGLIDTSRPVMENIEKICSAAGSWLSYDIHEGKWGVVVNEAANPVAAFNDSNILGPITVGGTGLSDLYNSVKVEFPHRDLRDSADYVTISIPSGDRNANEEDNTLNLSYDIINEPIQAQILGLIELKQSRIDLTISFESDFSTINLKAGDVISVTNSRLGFNEKLFRVISMEEIQDDDGALKIGITALEYKSSVYNLTDLYRYTRSDSNGIITIGSIGIPGTPQVTKFETDVRPRIEIQSTSPTGVVEGLEFWLTEDYLLLEPARSYKLVANIKPPGGGVFSSGTPVTLDYDNIDTGNFYVKTRGFNATTYGPFSEPSGLIEFTATQVTGAIGPETKTINAAGQLVTAIGVQALLKAVDGLFSGDTNSTSSIFKKVFDLLQQTTGQNLLGQKLPIVSGVTPSQGPTSGGTAVTIAGNNLTSATNVTFNGITATSISVVNSATITCVTPSGNPGNASVIVTTPQGSNSGNSLFKYVTTGTQIVAPSITSINPTSGPPTGGTNITIFGTNLSSATSVILGSVPATSVANVNSTTVIAITPANPVGLTNVIVETPNGTALLQNGFNYISVAPKLVITAKYPPDRQTYQDPVTQVTSDQAPTTGPYYLLFGKSNGLPFYGELSPGTSGSIKLYKSNGQLVETLTPNQLTFNNNRVGFPFATREKGTDYYILMDEGVIKYCDSNSPVIDQPTIWNFNTPRYDANPYVVNPTPFTNLNTTPVVTQFQTACYTFTMTYSTNVVAGTGNFTIRKASDNTVAATIPVGTTLISGNRVTFQNLDQTLATNATYLISAPAGIVNSYNVGDCFIGGAPSGVLSTTSFYIEPALSLITPYGFDVTSYPFDELADPGFLQINPETNLQFRFNKPIKFTNTGTITIYKADGTIHQAIDVITSFNNNKTSELIWIDNVINSMWVNPTKDFERGETYYVLASPTCVQSFCGDTWTGISDPYAARFTIAGLTFSSSSVTNTSTEITFTSASPIVAGTGTMIVYDNNNNVVASFPSTSTYVTFF